MKTIFSIQNQDLGIDYQDEGPWRSYELSTDGTNVKELQENCTVSEIDQDGGELRTYGWEDLPNNEVIDAVEIAILKEVSKKQWGDL